MIPSRWIPLTMKDVSDRIVEKIKTDILCSIFFLKSCRLWGKVRKYDRARHVKDDNMALSLCMLDTYGYKHTFRICGNNCFRTAKTVTRMRLTVTLCVSCPFLIRATYCLEILHAFFKTRWAPKRTKFEKYNVVTPTEAVNCRWYWGTERTNVPN